MSLTDKNIGRLAEINGDIKNLDIEWLNFIQSLSDYDHIFQVRFTERSGVVNNTGCIPKSHSLNLINEKAIFIKDHDLLIQVLECVKDHFKGAAPFKYYAQFEKSITDNSIDDIEANKLGLQDSRSSIDLWEYYEESSSVRSILSDYGYYNDSNNYYHFHMLNITVDILTVHGKYHLNECKDDEFFAVTYRNIGGKSKDIIAHSSFNLIEEIIGDRFNALNIALDIMSIKFMTDKDLEIIRKIKDLKNIPLGIDIVVENGCVDISPSPSSKKSEDDNTTD